MGLEARFRDEAYDCGLNDALNGRAYEPSNATKSWWTDGTTQERSEAKAQYRLGYKQGEAKRRRSR